MNAKATGLVAWMTMTFVGTLIRGGWVRPLATPAPGWAVGVAAVSMLAFPRLAGEWLAL